MISRISPDVVKKFLASFGRVLCLQPGEDQTTCVDDHAVLILLQMLKEITPEEMNGVCLTAFQKYTPTETAPNETCFAPIEQIWLDSLKILFARKSSDISWNISSLEMVYRSLKKREDLRKELLASTALHDVISAMIIVAESAPLLVIGIFELLKDSSNAMQELVYQEAANHLATLKDGECKSPCYRKSNTNRFCSRSPAR